MAKLKNIQAVKQMLEGSHATQTKKSVYFGGEKKQDRKIGDHWIDEEGTEWEQKDGYKINIPRFQEIRDMLEIPSTCPECKRPMKKRLDKKYYNMHKKCMDCVIEYETKLRIEGKYEEYEQEKVRQNILAWLKDAETEKEYLKRLYSKPIEYTNSDGTIEKWESPLTPEEMCQKIDEDFEKIKEEILSKL